MNRYIRLKRLIPLLLTAVMAAGCRDTTRILVVNPLPAQQAEFASGCSNPDVEISFATADEATDFDDYDFIMLYTRGLYLDSLQRAGLQRAAESGRRIIGYGSRSGMSEYNANLTSGECDTLLHYLSYPCRPNYASLIDYIRRIDSGSTDSVAVPVVVPEALFYHLDPGRYFTTASALREHLTAKGLYHEGAPTVALISGSSFPVEGNRAHVDSIISRLTADGYNVAPISAPQQKRLALISEANPQALIYLPMGVLGDDSLTVWLREHDVALFMPFPLTTTREEWLDADRPLSAGTLTARVTLPEFEGGMTPMCLSTQNPDGAGFIVNTVEPERMNSFIERFNRFMALRTKPNRDKRVAIAYFRMPGRDALLASGMEVMPSLYAFLRRLRSEGYNVDGLPATESAFRSMIEQRGAVMGDYASEAQKRFMDSADPVWISRGDYERMVARSITPAKYAEVKKLYGEAPGELLARGDSIAVAALRFGNILLFPQPRPALGDDEFRLVHGAKVAPPHSYLAPYLYMRHSFEADALIHFGTHGNLEFTPGKNAALSCNDWAEALCGNLPHFYFYTTANVGEGVIAKRRTQAVLVSHLTPPFVESGMRSDLSTLLEAIHAALADPTANTEELKRMVARRGFLGDLGIDTVSPLLTAEELERIDTYAEELADEKVTGSFYVMGRRYTPDQLRSTVIAMAADPLAYAYARDDRDRGLITDSMMQSLPYLRHHYLPRARREIGALTDNPASLPANARPELADAVRYRTLLIQSAGAEIDAMVGALSGHMVPPAPGGDPVASPDVLPTGRNTYSVNTESTPDEAAWRQGSSLAETTAADYRRRNGDWPKKVNYTFWAGEFITSRGATIAQALRMLGVEPLRDSRGRTVDLRLIPSAELGRPRIDVAVQVSGQLRDIAASRLKLITEAVRLASAATDDIYPNYVRESTLNAEERLTASGETPARARELSVMRVFGPVNSGYSTGMLGLTEHSSEWNDRSELAEAYLNNMCALYGDDDNWAVPAHTLFTETVRNTDVIVQPRQSNTWGPVSLDHVYEFTGGLSAAASQLTGREPEALLADYRNPRVPRMQQTKDAIAVETRSTLLNPLWVAERMKGDAGTAQAFGESMRNIFGWSAMRQSALPPEIYNELHDMYVADINGLGLAEWFDSVNPAAMQEITATMLESARKGYWKPDASRLKSTAELHAALTEQHGAPCTEFVCANPKLQQFVASNLSAEKGDRYVRDITRATGRATEGKVMERNGGTTEFRNLNINTAVVIGLIIAILAVAAVIIRRRRNASEMTYNSKNKQK